MYFGCTVQKLVSHVTFSLVQWLYGGRGFIRDGIAVREGGTHIHQQLIKLNN